MSDRMTKAEMINAVVEKVGISKTQAGNAVDAVFETIRESLAGGKKFTMTGFGTFQAYARKARPGRNPQTGERIVIPGKLVAKFKAGKKLKQAMESVESMSKWVNQ